MMSNKKPIVYNELTKANPQPPTPVEAVERLTANIEETKGELLLDQKFLKNLIIQSIENPDSFVREKKGESSAAEKKIKRHSLKGRTNKLKIITYHSDEEMEQMWSLVEHRGDRSPSDMWNQVICTALAALRML